MKILSTYKSSVLWAKLFLILLICLVFNTKAWSQNINLVRFNNSLTYTPESGVSVIINPTGVFQITNQFILELSDNTGSFTSPTVLKTLDEFYVPLINATLPAGLSAGNYKLRVRSTMPALSVVTGSFQVVNQTSIGIPLQKYETAINSNIFNCINNCVDTYNSFGTLNRSEKETTGTSVFATPQRSVTICNYDENYTYKIRMYNVQTGTFSTLSQFGGGFFQFPSNLGIGTYVIEVEKTNGTQSSVYATTFLFHGNATNLGNNGSENVCVGVSVGFSVDITQAGIGRNYPGSKYIVDFGDNSQKLILTHAQLIENPFLVHIFKDASCGQPDNYFIVQLDLYNKGIGGVCSEYVKNGLGVSKKVNTSSAPIANFTTLDKQCKNTSIVCNNIKDPLAGTGASCTQIAEYYWYFKRPSDADFIYINPNIFPGWVTSLDNLIIPNSFVNEAGCWEIKLEAKNPDLCQTVTEKINKIKVEATPTPSFTFLPNNPICTQNVVTFTNTTNVAQMDCQDPTYTWTVTPKTGTPATANGFSFDTGSTLNSISPKILFTQAGTYLVKLKVTNTCGTFFSTEQSIEIVDTPKITFVNNTKTDCQKSPASYVLDIKNSSLNPNFSSTPYTILSYEWSISGAGVTTSDYEFVNGTNANSDFPIIKFLAFKKYVLSVKATGYCDRFVVANSEFELKQTPEVTNVVSQETICAQEKSNGLVLTSNMSNTLFTWTAQGTEGISGFTTSGNGNIPQEAIENSKPYAGSVVYTIIPSNNGCQGLPFIYTVQVATKPMIAKQEISVCTGQNFEWKPTDGNGNILPNNSVYSWSKPTLTTGLSGGTEGVDLSQISDVFVNDTDQIQTATYTIIAKSGASGTCVSEPFLLVVNVEPKAKIKDIEIDVCSESLFEIRPENITDNIVPTGTTYSWDLPNISPLLDGAQAQNDALYFSVNLKNNSSVVQDATYIVHPKSTQNQSCIGDDFKILVHVYPKPKVQNHQITICSGDSFFVDSKR